MKEKQNVAPAFPINAFGLTFLGMSLRDYFAAKAMQSVANDSWTSEQALATWAYCVADAMLAERNK